MLRVKASSLLHVIWPDTEGRVTSELKYPDLKSVIDRHYSLEYKQLESLWLGESEDPEQLLDHEHLLMIAQKLQEAGSDEEKYLWSQRYTEASVSIYGRPEYNVVTDMARQEIEFFEHIVEERGACFSLLEPVFSVYPSLASDATVDTGGDLEKRYAPLLERLRSYIFHEYDAVLACFDEWSARMMPISEVKTRFTEALQILAERDAAWEDWTVTWITGSTLMVNPSKREVQIGRYLTELPTKRVKGLFAHEVLVHAQRSVNGHRLSRPLALGLDNQICAEEGLGVVIEAAVNGQIPYRIKDRYIDIALALGMHGEQPMTRNELFELAYSRTLARRVSEGGTPNRELLKRIMWTHVNRIYKGSLGNDFVGVFTRDLSYYEGFRRMANYILHRTDWGGEVADVMDYLLCGKFDPTNPHHLVYIQKHL